MAKAVRQRGLAERIVIWARRPETRLGLREQPWCDRVVEKPEEAVHGSDLVVLAAPVEKIIALAQHVAPHLAGGAIVTDVGSVKGELCRLCHTAMRPGTFFVGSHPMAGSQKTGWENASESLFDQRVCFVTPLETTDSRATETVAKFWRELGAEVTTIPPDTHDEIVAHISHLPQALATTLCSFLSQKPAGWRNFAGGGLKDTTRIAASDAVMWIEIFQQNRDEILRALRELQTELHSFQSALANRDWPEIKGRLERGKTYRDGMRP